MKTSIKIRFAKPIDAAYFPDIEQSAGELFRTIGDLAWIADTENLTDPHYADLIQCGSSWVAQTEDGPLIGFLCAETMEHELHIHELAISLDFQRQGIGRRLLETAVAWASEQGLLGVTLTTFREVAWNEHFYARAGFETLPENRLRPSLAAIMKFEIERGMLGDRRCAMWRPLNHTLE
jgi:GNAT superfamily N-acetyltransferase